MLSFRIFNFCLAGLFVFVLSNLFENDNYCLWFSTYILNSTVAIVIAIYPKLVSKFEWLSWSIFTNSIHKLLLVGLVVQTFRSIVAEHESDRLFKEYYPNASAPNNFLGFIPPYYGTVLMHKEGTELMGVLSVLVWLKTIKLFRTHKNTQLKSEPSSRPRLIPPKTLFLQWLIFCIVFLLFNLTCLYNCGRDFCLMLIGY